MTEQYEVFDQNFDGILFVLQKTVPVKHKELILEVFYSTDSIGESIDFDSIDFDNIKDESIFQETLISYLLPQKVKLLSEILNKIDREYFLSQYDSVELNDNKIYPTVWNDDKMENSAFNRKHIEEGFDSLKSLFNDSAKHESYILSFMG
jgi:hypothetical protein